MFKNVYTTRDYVKVEERRYNKYTLNGKHFWNGGDIAEILYKDCLGYAPLKDFDTDYNNGSDVAETGESVKTFRFSLTKAVIGYDFESTMKAYVENVASDWHTFIVLEGNTLTAYKMTLDEFIEFMSAFGYYEKSTHKVRIKNLVHHKIIDWLENRL